MISKCELEHLAKGICMANGYEYICFIDAGAFKETYQIRGPDEQTYALKIFKSNNNIERTNREIGAMRRTECTNIARLIKVDTFPYEDENVLYLLEEYLAGGSLGRLIKSAPLNRHEIISVAKSLINALESMHREHIVHRDIKPDNIMFRGDRTEAVLVDFGLVRDLDASSLTQAFHMRGPGTALFSAPEQLNNNKALIDWRTDQFALGITLYLAFFNSHPFEAGTLAGTVERIASMTNCNESAVGQIKQHGLDPIIKMLEPFPVRRYRTPKQLETDWSRLEV